MINQIKKELRKNSEGAYYKLKVAIYSKEKSQSYGVRTGVVRKVAAKAYQQVKDYSKKEIYALAEELFSSRLDEEMIVAAAFVNKRKKEWAEADFPIFVRWFKKYVRTWYHNDDFCARIIAPFLETYPKFISRIKAWSKSKNRWQKRASAVALISKIGSGNLVTHNLRDIFEVANNLLTDEDDLVRKGYGWLLKEATLRHQKEVFNFVDKNRARMPRVALRYAIEKMPPKLKARAMKM